MPKTRNPRINRFSHPHKEASAMNRVVCSVTAAAALALAGPGFAAPIVINGSGTTSGINSGFGDVVGATSTIDVTTDVAGNVSMTFNFGSADLNDSAVVYIDSDSGATGVTNTSTLTDTFDPLRSAISGTDGTNSSDLGFASGFAADTAIAFNTGFAGMWNALGVDPSDHAFVKSVGAAPSATDASASFAFTMADLGLTAGDSFRFVVTYLNSGNAFRSDEFHGVAPATASSGNIGQSPLNLASGDFNTVNSVPEPGSLALMGLGGLLMLRRRSA
ncbi:MAG: PEP-CTERM sorting domain-containing protein [Planctomycetes bacterium]|jgi:hypothetical protein|nr:PEP-CTERM sorting domain-containing protein [Planctomycetota bacterium]